MGIADDRRMGGWGGGYGLRGIASSLPMSSIGPAACLLATSQSSAREWRASYQTSTGRRLALFTVFESVFVCVYVG